MQKIVLCAGLEKNRRALFRRASRATMILIMRLGFGDEVASLSLAASTLGCGCPALVVPQQPTMFEVLWRKVCARHVGCWCWRNVSGCRLTVCVGLPKC